MCQISRRALLVLPPMLFVQLNAQPEHVGFLPFEVNDADLAIPKD